MQACKPLPRAALQPAVQRHTGRNGRLRWGKQDRTAWAHRRLTRRDRPACRRRPSAHRRCQCAIGCEQLAAAGLQGGARGADEAQLAGVAAAVAAGPPNSSARTPRHARLGRITRGREPGAFGAGLDALLGADFGRAQLGAAQQGSALQFHARCRQVTQLVAQQDLPRRVAGEGSRAAAPEQQRDKQQQQQHAAICCSS